MMGRVTMHDVGGAPIDQVMRKFELRIRDVIAPVRAPMDGDDDDIAGLPLFENLLRNESGGSGRQVR